jgi:hypothetical protein
VEAHVAQFGLAESEITKSKGEIDVGVEFREEPRGVAVGGEEFDHGLEVPHLVLLVNGVARVYGSARMAWNILVVFQRLRRLVVGETMPRAAIILCLVALISGCWACAQNYSSRNKFEAFVSSQNLVGLSLSDASSRLSGKGFQCEPYGLPSAPPAVLCSQYIVGCSLAEEVTVMLHASADRSTVTGVVPGYVPITGP